MRFRMRHLGKLLFVALALAALAGAVMLLWNAVMPGVFTGARTIDYLQALGLLVLSRILLGGFRGDGGWHGGWHGRQHWAGRWQAMSPEEREQFRRHMPRHGRGGWHERWHGMHDGPQADPQDGAPGAPREGAPR